jgi:hypothetical protein
MTDENKVKCPDDGTCHHGCKPGTECWRTQTCEPLSAYGEEWGSDRLAKAAFPDDEEMPAKNGEQRVATNGTVLEYVCVARANKNLIEVKVIKCPQFPHNEGNTSFVSKYYWDSELEPVDPPQDERVESQKVIDARRAVKIAEDCYDRTGHPHDSQALGNAEHRLRVAIAQDKERREAEDREMKRATNLRKVLRDIEACIAFKDPPDTIASLERWRDLLKEIL